ncbi:hypothetical protein BBMN23_0447 [Bifidobacterium adolescentis]|nr:hypothetical protein BBMN23_0447 [Bifidobacterium adolescentis]
MPARLVADESQVCCNSSKPSVFGPCPYAKYHRRLSHIPSTQSGGYS